MRSPSTAAVDLHFSSRSADRSCHTGIYAFIPGVASLLVKFHPEVLPQGELIDLLVSTSTGLAEESLDLLMTARRIHLPVVFNDSSLKETIRRYQESTGRKKAVYLPDNLEYLAKANAMSGWQEIASTFCSADWYVVSRSFFAGLPMLGPFDQRCIFSSQKYKCVPPFGSILCSGATDTRAPPPARPVPSRLPARSASPGCRLPSTPSTARAATSSWARP